VLIGWVAVVVLVTAWVRGACGGPTPHPSVERDHFRDR